MELSMTGDRFRARCVLATISFWWCLSAIAVAAQPADGATTSIAGLSVQVSEGGTIPSAAALKAILPPGGSVRDTLSWRNVEQSHGHYTMPGADWQLYSVVASVGGRNVITLFSGNTLYGTHGDFGFPVTPEQIKAFANFAGWAVRNDGTGAPNDRAANIPALSVVTIWNEFNGTWHAGVPTGEARRAAMAALLNAVVPQIRASNPSVRIAAGAFVGHYNLAFWFEDIGKSFDWSTVDYLDVHPYLAQMPAAQQWEQQVKLLRNGNAATGAPPIKNPMFFSEWGGPSAANYSIAHQGDPTAPSYCDWFVSYVVNADSVSVAGGNYFTLFDMPAFPNQGLLSGPSPGSVTTLGQQFQQAFLH
jgi:hypothetical protein